MKARLEIYTQSLIFLVGIIISLLVFSCSKKEENREEERKNVAKQAYKSNLDFIKIRKSVVRSAKSFTSILESKTKLDNTVGFSGNVEKGIYTNRKKNNNCSVYLPLKGTSISSEELESLKTISVFDTIFGNENSRNNMNNQFFYMDVEGGIVCHPYIDIHGSYGKRVDFLNAQIGKEGKSTSWKWRFTDSFQQYNVNSELIISQPIFEREQLKGVVGVTISKNKLLYELLNTGEYLQLLCDKHGRIIVGHPDAYKILGVSEFQRTSEYVFKSKFEEVREAMKYIFLEGNFESFFEVKGRRITIIASDLYEIDAKLIRLINNQ